MTSKRCTAAAEGKEGQYFFLDQNNVPTAVVSGDPALMTVCAYLEGGEPYEDAFITVDATPDDQATLKKLEEKAKPDSDSNVPTSDKDGGGCDAGLGALVMAAIIPALVRKKK